MAQQETGDERAQALLERGASLYEEGKLYDAISCWREVLDIDPHNEIAAEYLRFIEDNFQIGIDAFLEHHRPAPVRTFDGDEGDLEAAIDESINAMLDDSIEELDWSELLEEGPDDGEAPPPPSEVADADEAFFPALEAGSLTARPGTEAEAWGHSPSRPRTRPRFDDDARVQHSLEMMPEHDPFELPTERFAVPFEPGEDDSDALAVEPDTDPAPQPSPATRPASAAVADPRKRRRDLAEMSDDSIDLLLDEDFKAWEEKGAEELPFESPRSQPPGSSPPPDEGRGRSSTSEAPGVHIDRRRAPSFEGPRPAVPDASLRHATGPLSPVDPRTRDVAGVDRVGRTTPPPGNAGPRRSSVPPPPRRGAPAAGSTGQPEAASTPAEPVFRDTAVTPVVSPTRAEAATPPAPGVEPASIGEPAAAAPPPAGEPTPVAEPAPAPASPPAPLLDLAQPAAPAPAAAAPAAAAPAALAATPAAAAATPVAAARRRHPSPPPSPRPPPPPRPCRPEPAPAAATRARGPRRAEKPAPPPPETDLDDALRAILSAGIAAIDAVETPATPARRPLAAPPPGADLDAIMVEARRKQQADDFTGALALVEQVLAADANHAEARRYLTDNTTRLLAMYRARLGSLGRVPRVRLRQQEIVWQSLDHREGFILSQVDGRTTYQDIIDIAGMPELESTRILARLVDHGVIG
ncbi:MAG: hypothetical protein H6703_16545 [Myxococcales bacterium]|nr:hypothetical protein [Myxococcales bacterium]